MNNQFLKKGKIMMAALTMLCGSYTANAAVIEHQVDRIVINVDQMDLNGEETLLDILMMIPDVVSIDGQQPINGGIQKKLFGQYVVRVDNMNIQINPMSFVKNTKAKELRTVKICVNPGIQKGCGGLKQVIDIYYKKEEKGNKGNAVIEADSYGKAGLWAMNNTTGDNYSLHTYAIGELEYRKHDCEQKNCGSVNEHGASENLRAHLNWDISDKDNMLVTAAQGFSRAKEQGGAPEFNREFYFDDCYTRDLGNGAYAMFQAGIDYNHNNSLGFRSEGTNPYGLIELGAPFISKNIYINGGIEGGYSAETAGVVNGPESTSRSSYEDIYAQIDWNCGKFNLSLGDRVRFSTIYRDKVYANEKYNHTHVFNHYTASSWLDINDNNTIQATFARRFFDGSVPTIAGFYVGQEVENSPVYTAELRYTYQKQDFHIMGIVKNVHTNNAAVRYDNGAFDHDNILQVGASAWFHMGILRMTAGLSYNWQKSSYISTTKYNNFVNIKLIPQVSLKDGLRLTSTLLYNSRKAYDSEFYSPANFYAEVGASKEFNEHWLVEAKFHDIAGQHTGNRGVSVGATYSW